MTTRMIDYNEWIKREADAWGREQRELLESRFLPHGATMNKFVLVSFKGGRWVQAVNNLPDDIERSRLNFTPAVHVGFAGVCVQGEVDTGIVARGLAEKLREKYDTMIEDLRRERALLDEPLGDDECTHGEISDSATPTS